MSRRLSFNRNILEGIIRSKSCRVSSEDYVESILDFIGFFAAKECGVEVFQEERA